MGVCSYNTLVNLCQVNHRFYYIIHKSGRLRLVLAIGFLCKVFDGVTGQIASRMRFWPRGLFNTNDGLREEFFIYNQTIMDIVLVLHSLTGAHQWVTKLGSDFQYTRLNTLLRAYSELWYFKTRRPALATRNPAVCSSLTVVIKWLASKLCGGHVPHEMTLRPRVKWFDPPSYAE